MRRVGQACIGVRDTHGIDAGNPYAFEAVKDRIEHGLAAHKVGFIVVPLPNITHVFHGRQVGYSIEHIALGDELEAISATDIRGRIAQTV